MKSTRIIKRRVLANAACRAGAVKINGKVAKPGAKVKPGDVVEVQLGNRRLLVEVLEGVESSKRVQPSNLYRLLEEGP